MTSQHVAVIGAGIVGLAHAWSAAKRGHRVTVFERSPQASGGSIRNFGMVWPIGQPIGPLRLVALESQAAWLELGRSAGVWVNHCGSFHLAHHADEWEVLRQFHELAAGQGIETTLLSADEVVQRTQAANPHQLQGGLFSPTELCVNPRQAIARLAVFLAENFGVRFEFNTTIVQADENGLKASNGRTWHPERTIVCSGPDFETLFPEVLRSSGLKRCKLQMLKTVPQPEQWKLGPHIASGLTLRHYANFEGCPALVDVKARIAGQSPELDRYGIHVMASQNDLGEVILGDSHEYDESIEPFNRTEIDELILRELRDILRLPNWSITERWHGLYAKFPTGPAFQAEPIPGIHIHTGTGGAGMTMSFGLAEQAWRVWSPDMETA
ncbi:MAG: TIGR03364 family FAD-dependent oxidoreductase [Pirellulaceae bacterium]